MSERPHLRAFLKSQFLLLLLAVVAVELVLQFLHGYSRQIQRVLAPPWELDTPVVADNQMIVRGNPLRLDVDSEGYRNPSRLQVADVVTLGDSQSWGPEEARQSWPSIVAKLTGLTIYNMALPGYGPLHSLLQLDEALSLRPKLIIVAPYFGNDFYDSFVLFQRHPELAKSLPKALVEDAIAAEGQRPIQAEAEVLFDLGQAQTPSSEDVGSVRRWISDHVRFYQLFRALRYRFRPQRSSPLLSRRLETAAAALTPQQQHYASVFNGPEWKTILTASYRSRVVDDHDPRIRLGFELARYAVQLIAERCRVSRTNLLVVLIPTKESVFFPHVRTPGSHPGLEKLVANEARLKTEWIIDLESRGIRYIDVTPGMQEATVQPYPEDVDGHPTPEGNRIIAVAVAREIASANRAWATKLEAFP